MSTTNQRTRTRTSRAGAGQGGSGGSAVEGMQAAPAPAPTSSATTAPGSASTTKATKATRKRSPRPVSVRRPVPTRPAKGVPEETPALTMTIIRDDRPKKLVTLTVSSSDANALVGLGEADAKLVREIALTNGPTDIWRLIQGARDQGYALMIRTDLVPIV